MSKPILATRGSALVAVANVPCTGCPVRPTRRWTGGTTRTSELNRASGRSTQTPYCSPRVTSSRSGYCVEQVGDLAATAPRRRGRTGRRVRAVCAAASISG